MGTSSRPRLSVFKSNKFVHASLIDDERGFTITSANSSGVKGKNNVERAKETGKIIAAKSKTKKINLVVFDRAGYVYTGAVRALAEGAREGGLSF